jgi:DNA-binding transcriptional regulator LsrR (DeoR family)
MRHDRADLQWKLAQLYFVRGWNCEAIAAKYGLIHQRVRQILKTWKGRAVVTGYIQVIPAAGVLTPLMPPLCPIFEPEHGVPSRSL